MEKINKILLLDTLFIIGIFILGTIAGFLINNLYKEIEYEKEYDGLRIGGNYTKKEVLNKVKNYDEYGDWVCINIRNMDYERAVEVCQHEAGHEIFAEILENNPEKIKDVMKIIED